MKRLSDSVFDAEASGPSLVVGASRNSVLSQPHSQWFRLTIDCCCAPFTTFALIVVLLFVGSPSAVLEVVGTVVVDSVQAVKARRPAPHVGKEVLVAKPPLTDGDSPSSIRVELGVLGIAASSLHLCPGAVLRCFFAVGSFPMSAAGFAPLDTLLSAQTPARAGPSAAKAVPTHYPLVPAIAFAEPACLAFDGFCLLDNAQAAIALSFDIQSQNHSQSIAQQGLQV